MKDRVEITKGSGKVNRISLKTLGEGQSSIPILRVSSSKGWLKIFYMRDNFTVNVVEGRPTGSGIVGHTLGKSLKE